MVSLQPFYNTYLFIIFKMSYIPVQYNVFYYNNLCHVCKEWNQNLKRCSGCKTIAYCSKDHQRQDWKLHKDLCRAIAKTDCGDLSLKRVAINNWEHFKKYNVLRGYLWEKKMSRALTSFESQMWMFPRACALCLSSNVTTDCSNCLNVSYCSELHKAVHEPQHSKFCAALKLCMYRDLYHFHRKIIPTEVNVHDFEPEIKNLPNSLLDLMVLYEKADVPSEDISDEMIQFMFKSDLLAPAATILYGLEKSELLKDRLLNKSDLTVHIVGADCMSEMGWLWKLMAELPFHWINNLRKLDFYLIGPELNHNGVTEKSAEQLCDSCKAKHLRTKIIFHWMMYHEVACDIKKPDIVVALNSGIHEAGDENMWHESIDCLTMHPDVPLLLTAYTLNEIVKDVYTVKSRSTHDVTTILEPQKNPFSTMRPIRDWETEDSPIFYINGYIAILKAK